MTFTCAEPVSVAMTFAGSESFLQLPGATQSDGVTMGLQFRTWNKAGLLITFDLQPLGATLWLYLSEARVKLQIHKAGRMLLDLTAGWSHPDTHIHTHTHTAVML